MQEIHFPPRADWPALLQRPTQDISRLEAVVKPILARVKAEGDAAVRDFTAQFDGVTLVDPRVDAETIAAAEAALDQPLKAAIRLAKANIETFHAAQRHAPQRIETMPGVVCWRKDVAIERVGLYIPGGSAPLFSTVLMLGVPAALAGCRGVVLCTPADKTTGQVHPAVLYAAHLVGITQVFAIGGAQAIAAMAYGTATVPRVHKIFGPGNQYVTAAKQLITQDGVAIDMPAGPSEVAVYADDSANAVFVAADLLAQAEHGADSQVLLVTESPALAAAVQAELTRQLATLPRRELATKALENSKLLVMPSSADSLELLNAYAAEHLILAVDNAEAVGEQIINAGSVFLGHYAPESAGDYASGTNHTLPTNGYARAYSGVSLDSFVKKITFQHITEAGLRLLGPAVETLATAESLVAHQRAVRVRLAR